jgi:casein kinase II subunit alpha
MFAGLIFKKEPFFRGNDNKDQLVKIARVLGTDELDSWMDRYGLLMDSQFRVMINRHTKKPWKKFVTPENQNLAVNDAIDLLDKLLRYDPAERLTAREAMEHPYFAPLKVSQPANQSS